MPSTINYHEDPKGLLAILKGESGEGKSTAALSFPTPYVFDFDMKMPTIALKHFPGKDISWDSFEYIWDVETKVNEFLESCPYETLIIDSITGLVNICVDSVSFVKGESVPEILKRVSKKSNTIEMMGIDYYSAEDRFCTWFSEQLIKLHARPGNPKNVIFIAHVVTVESAPDLKTKVVTRTRSIVAKGRKFPAWLPTKFDNVYIVGRELPDLGDIDQTPKRVVITEAFGEDSAKCSYPFESRVNFTNVSFYDKLVSQGLNGLAK